MTRQAKLPEGVISVAAFYLQIAVQPFFQVLLPC